MTSSRARSPEPARSGFHGRRKGRALGKRRTRLLETLLPQFSVALPESGRLDLGALFPGGGPVWVEIGFGGGEHLAWQAEQHPETGFVGVELFVNGIASLLRHIDERRLSNVRVLAEEAGAVLAALPDAAVGRLFALFPDPWPKARHHKRRLIRPAILDEIARVLAPGAEFRFATDHGGYCRWTLARLLAHPGLAWPAETAADFRARPADWPATRYEQAAAAEGRPATYLTFVRRG